ncbi:hypothetical protein C7M84_008391 [Penaeus vannamei]|uniref:Ig-like domain-containing protein n=1 Tax=Penaeus vannamei TaxID=6689 RepID=A0A423T9J0_PENVA|nr:hypothetical protein C7M84_008391 [Penaeus vannamei]
MALQMIKIYDARAGKDHRFPTLFNGSGGGGGEGQDLDSSRMRLEEGGTSLVVEDVHKEDVAEYRCRVHFRLSPTWTQRLLLTVPEFVSGLVLVNLAGQVVTGGRVGPLSEGDLLTLTCKALHGAAKVESLQWILGGVEVDSTWRRVEEGIATNVLDLGGLDQRHHNARLTCRLTTSDPAHANVLANITDVSTIITMFHVPEATILVDGGREDEGGHEVTEGDGVTFNVCPFLFHLRSPPSEAHRTGNLNLIHVTRVCSHTLNPYPVYASNPPFLLSFHASNPLPSPSTLLIPLSSSPSTLLIPLSPSPSTLLIPLFPSPSTTRGAWSPQAADGGSPTTAPCPSPPSPRRTPACTPAWRRTRRATDTPTPCCCEWPTDRSARSERSATWSSPPTPR